MQAQDQPVMQPTQPVMSMPAQPMPGTAVENPGKNMGVAGLVLAFFMPIIGLIVSIIGLKKSKAANQSNGLALAGIIVSIINTILIVIGIIALTLATVAAVEKCQELGSGTHVVDGVTYTCN
jgi:Ca2+/H+ antiporter